MKKIGHFFKQLNFGLFKTTFYTINLKIIRSLIFPKCLVVPTKECTWEEGIKFYVFTNFAIHFTLYFIFVRVYKGFL